jgi:hypothetical protein
MTSLIAWLGVDARGPSSLYLASDSRFSWPNHAKWDFGRKVFTSTVSADVFAFCGAVDFPAFVLGRVTAQANAEPLLRDADAARRHDEFVSMVRGSFVDFPSGERRAFSILHGARSGEGMSVQFRLWHTNWTPSADWTDLEIPIPTESELLVALGSGNGVVSNHDFHWRKSQVGRTSRAVFGAFCDALLSRADPFTGGAPQLVGLYRTGDGHPFGVVFRGEPFANGAPMLHPQDRSTLEWRNEQFERCGSETLLLLDGAQRQPRPSDLRSPAG